MRWDIVTFSLGYQIDPSLIDSDILHFQNVSFPDTEEILVVNDASEDVGSGGSALNALIRTAERLCYRKQLKVLIETVLQDVNVLIVLVSDPKAILNSNSSIKAGNGFIFDTYLLHSVQNAQKTAEKTLQKGIWIIGSDALWNLDSLPDSLNHSQDSITGFTFPAIKALLEGHGWYRTNENDELIGMEFDGEFSGGAQEKEEGFLILSFLYLPSQVATAFLSLHSDFPVAASTYLGVDSNVTPLKLSIFFDFMLATCLSEANFVSSKLGNHLKISENVRDRSNARRQIYQKLNTFKTRIQKLNITGYQYKSFPEDQRNYLKLLMTPSSDTERQLRCLLSICSIQGLNRGDSAAEVLRFYRNRLEVTGEFLSPLFASSLALSIASDGKGGLRNGPAKNPIFENILKEGDWKTGLLRMFDEILENWLWDPCQMIRAARHLEMAAQKCIHAMVDEMCDSQSLRLQKTDSPSPSYVKVTAPARIDFFGGWLDTPPIYLCMENAAVVNMAIQLDGKSNAALLQVNMADEMCVSQLKLQKCDEPGPSYVKVTAPVRIDFFGGWLDTPPIYFYMENAAVVNMAIQLDGKNPISCTITKIDEPHIQLIQDETSILIKTDQELVDMYDKPSEAGALVCACIVALGFRSLAPFFEVIQCTGLRIETKSELPHGSGLGTSSIMSCAILEALCSFGMVEEGLFEYQIIHTVLQVEQLMTTGGGWQDQFGAVYEGLKKCYYVEDQGLLHEPIHLSPSVKTLLEERLLLVYTGKTRLAKNLLQEVIRNFFACNETKKKLMDMADNVDEFCRRIEEGDVPVELLEMYHKTKVFMTGSEPPIVTELLDELKGQNLIDVGWAAGAGGGGFMYLWLSADTSPSSVKQFLSSTLKFSKMTCHNITIPLDSTITLETN